VIIYGQARLQETNSVSRTRQSNGGESISNFKQTFTYDRFGNLTASTGHGTVESKEMAWSDTSVVPDGVVDEIVPSQRTFTEVDQTFRVVNNQARLVTAVNTITSLDIETGVPLRPGEDRYTRVVSVVNYAYDNVGARDRGVGVQPVGGGLLCAEPVGGGGPSGDGRDGKDEHGRVDHVDVPFGGDRGGGFRNGIVGDVATERANRFVQRRI
jgi:hypothetical protein